MQTVHEAFAQAAAAEPKNSFLCIPHIEPGASKDISYAEAAAQIDSIRNAYAAAGFGHGHRIALLLGQKPEFVYHYLALNALGCTIVPVNPDYRQGELVYLLNHSEAEIAVTTDNKFEDLRGAAAQGNRAVPIVKAGDFPSLLRATPRTPALPGRASLESIATLLYTSGTTGQPKGCLLSNDCVLIAGARYRDLGGMLTIFPERDRLYNPSPFHHVNNLVVALTCMILTRNCLILSDRFSPTRWWPEIASSGATIIHYLGVGPSMLMATPVSPMDRKHKARFGFGAGIEPNLHEPFEKRFGFPLIEIWGMTEIPRVFAANFEPRQINTRAFGKSDHENEGRVVDEGGQEVPDGTAGEFVVRTKGPDPRRGFFSGYLKNEQASQEAWKDGWYHTGDVVYRGADGMFCFVDRKKNIIRRGGENISAAEVESVIFEHPAVDQVACIAAPDDLREEEVMACIVTKGGAPRDADTAYSIFAWCHSRLAYYKAPGWLIFLDSLPLTSSQRLQRTRIFAPGEDPRHQPGVFDLRALKKRNSVQQNS